MGKYVNIYPNGDGHMLKRLGKNKKDGLIITISFKDLTALALLYNFLANGSTSLQVTKVLNLYYHIEHCKYYNKIISCNL